MTATVERTVRSGIHPLHAVLLAGTIPLFLGAALSDYLYSTSYHIQWSTFSSWLIAGGLVFTGFAILAAPSRKSSVRSFLKILMRFLSIKNI